MEEDTMNVEQWSIKKEKNQMMSLTNLEESRKNSGKMML